MTRNETAKILSVLKAAYPDSYRRVSSADAETMINLWAAQFASEAYETVGTAVSALISTRTAGYSPTIGEVKEALQKLKASGSLPESEAWALVSKACRNGIYGYKREFARLPPEIQRVVGDPEQLRDWAMLDEEVVQSVIASNFRKSYAAQMSREKEKAMLPKEVQNLIGGIAEGMRTLES